MGDFDEQTAPQSCGHPPGCVHVDVRLPRYFVGPWGVPLPVPPSVLDRFVIGEYSLFHREAPVTTRDYHDVFFWLPPGTRLNLDVPIIGRVLGIRVESGRVCVCVPAPVISTFVEAMGGMLADGGCVEEADNRGTTWDVWLKPSAGLHASIGHPEHYQIGFRFAA